MAEPNAYDVNNAAQVRRDDFDRYLTVLYAPKKEQAGLFALYAFNIELAKTREVVSEPMLGEIRLQWWREAVEELYAGSPRKHDVVLAVADLVSRAGLPQQALIDLIDEREADLYDTQPETLVALKEYAGRTSGALQRLAAQALGGDQAAQIAAEQVGTAWALTGLMRAIPFHFAQGRIFMPKRMLLEAGLTDPTKPDAEQTAALASVLRKIADRARALLRDARDASAPRQTLPALLLAPLTDHYLKVLARAGYDPEMLNDEKGALARQIRLLWAALRGRY